MNVSQRKRFKAALGEIKQQLETSESKTLDELHDLLMRAELLTRGVVCTVEGKVDDEDYARRFDDFILSCLGKRRLSMEDVDQGVPVQLCVGSFAMCAIAAEKIHGRLEVCRRDDGCVMLSDLPVPPRRVERKLMERCKVVQDESFEKVLYIFHFDNRTAIEESSIEALHISRTRFLSAAKRFMKDQPQMWRKALDVTLKLPETMKTNSDDNDHVYYMPPSDAIAPLQNLARIVSKKGTNQKKVTEFYVLLAGAHLRQVIEGDGDQDSFRIIEEYLSSCEEHMQLLESEMAFAVNILSSKSEFLKEDNEIAAVMGELQDNDVNRSTVEKRSYYEKEARAKVFLNSDDDIYYHVEIMRDTFLETMRNSEDGCDQKNFLSALHDAVKILISCNARFVDRIRALASIKDKKSKKIARPRLLRKLYNFVEPILKYFRESIKVGLMHNPLKELRVTISRTILFLDWVDTSGEIVEDKILGQVISYFDEATPCADKEIVSSKTAAKCMSLFCKSTAEQSKYSKKSIQIAKEDTESYPNGTYGSAFYKSIWKWGGFVTSQPWSYCNTDDARKFIECAKTDIKFSENVFGRTATQIDKVLLLLMEADLELHFMGQNLSRSFTLYSQVVDYFEELISVESSMERSCSVLKAYALRGLVKCILKDKSIMQNRNIDIAYSERRAKEAFDLIERNIVEISRSFSYRTSILSLMSSLLKCVLLQLIAESLLQQENAEAALIFLRRAVESRPNDYHANYLFATMQLRTYFLSPEDLESSKQQVQRLLLKTAKLDPSQANPFALLGLWFEYFNDSKRSLGCYSKSLDLDPCNPIAGYGVCRLLKRKEALMFCSKAASKCSPFIGWAWVYLGRDAIATNKDDIIASKCFQEALLMRDVTSLKENQFFYVGPKGKESIGKFLSHVWCELADCYRRLGKFTAALKAFRSASDTSPQTLSPSILCRWAQVEAELGLHIEAYTRFKSVLQQYEFNESTAFGLARSCLPLSKVCLEEGKHALALKYLFEGIGVFERHSAKSLSAFKCLGDLYSFGYTLPHFLFSNDNGLKVSQLQYISKGENSYRSAYKLSEEKNLDASMRAALMCDIGINLLLQGQICLQSLFIPSSNDDDHIKRFKEASECFLLSIKLEPSYSIAWSGLGTSLIHIDPILSQHCFCRSLELDKSGADSWSNYAFACLNFDAKYCCVESLDALTQIADSPMMWIGRALLLESKGRLEGNSSALSKAADAYRTALQVSREPSALLGVALTCRHLHDQKNETKTCSKYVSAVNNLAFQEFLSSIYSFNSIDYRRSVHGSVVGILAMIEESFQLSEITSSCYLREEAKSETAHFPSQKLNDIIGKDTHYFEDLAGITKKVSRIAANATLRSTETTFEIPFDTLIDSCVAKKILHENPCNGHAWINLAKALMNDLNATDKVKEVSKVLASAKSAVYKAIEISNASAVNPNRILPIYESEHHLSRSTGITTEQGLSLQPVSSSFLAESYALLHWFLVSSYQQSENLIGVEGKVEPGPTTIHLQRSLILDPENKMALHLMDAKNNSTYR